jgi:creatinase
VEFVDIAADAMSQRTIKSAEEHALIREGARICDIGGAAVADAVAPGVPSTRSRIASTNAMIREIARSFPRRADGHLDLVPVGHQHRRRAQSGHQQEVEPGDILSLNCFPMIFGYYTALERTLFCDHVRMPI